MNIVLNGEPTVLPSKVKTIDDLFDHYSVNTLRTALERNGQVVLRSDYSKTALAEDDRLEIVTFVGGG